MRVVKFGGSSLATGTSVNQALEIILADSSTSDGCLSSW